MRSGALLNKNAIRKFGDDFGGDEETIISSSFDRPVRSTTTDFDQAFYMQPDAQRPELTLAFDMIAPEGTANHRGSQRIHDYDLLLKRLREHNLAEESFTWYLDLRRYGSVPHSGFGMAWSARRLDLRRRTHSRSHSLPADYRVYP